MGKKKPISIGAIRYNENNDSEKHIRKLEELVASITLDYYQKHKDDFK